MVYEKRSKLNDTAQELSSETSSIEVLRGTHEPDLSDADQHQSPHATSLSDSPLFGMGPSSCRSDTGAIAPNESDEEGIGAF